MPRGSALCTDGSLPLMAFSQGIIAADTGIAHESRDEHSALETFAWEVSALITSVCINSST